MRYMQKDDEHTLCRGPQAGSPGRAGKRPLGQGRAAGGELQPSSLWLAALAAYNGVQTGHFILNPLLHFPKCGTCLLHCGCTRW